MKCNYSAIFLFFLLLFFVNISYAQTPKNSNQTHPQSTVSGKKEKHQKYSYEIIDAPEKTFGYNILRNNKVLITQTNVPGKNGLSGFKMKVQAEKSALLVIKKLKNGQMPPTLTKEEIDIILQ